MFTITIRVFLNLIEGASGLSKLYIQQIYQLVDEFDEGRAEFHTTLSELNQHLGRARRTGSIAYEVKTLNAISLLFVSNNQLQESIQYLGEALEISYQTDNPDLILKLDNNLGIEYLNIWGHQ